LPWRIGAPVNFGFDDFPLIVAKWFFRFHLPITGEAMIS